MVATKHLPASLPSVAGLAWAAVSTQPRFGASGLARLIPQPLLLPETHSLGPKGDKLALVIQLIGSKVGSKVSSKNFQSVPKITNS
jgi:hypothetical protein